MPGVCVTRNVQTQAVFSPPSPWVSLLLYALLLNTGILLAGSYASLVGNTKIYPRVFFGVFATGIPVLLLGGICAILCAQTMYRRVMWDMVGLVFTVAWATGQNAVFGGSHVRAHGNDAGTMPFEVPGDLGSTFIAAHASVFLGSMLVAMACARAILGYSLDAYPLSNFSKIE